MRQIIIIIYVFVGLVCCSCGTDSSEIGTDFFNGGGALDISYIDSASVKLSTVRYDSLITSNVDRFLLGTYVDNKLGRITASAFFQVGLPSSTDLDEDDISYDYATIILKYDAYSYYDTASSLTLYAHRLTEELELDEESGYLYNTSQFSVDKSPLGSVTFNPKPNRTTDSVEIKLSETFSQELFQKVLADDDEDLENTTEFLEYLKGFAIIPDTTVSSAMIGFSTSAELRIYYIDRSVIPSEQKYISFPVKGGSYTGTYFSQIKTNRTQTKLNTLPSQKSKLGAAVTDNEAYLQAGAGLALRVDMPYLRHLTQYTNFFVTQAVLEIYPTEKSYSDLMPLPETLVVYTADKKNNIYGQLATNATRIEDIDLDRDTHYYLDVTAFVKTQIATQEYNDNGLIFVLEDVSFRSSVTRIYAAVRGNKYKTRVRIYFATVNN